MLLGPSNYYRAPRWAARQWLLLCGGALLAGCGTPVVKDLGPELVQLQAAEIQQRARADALESRAAGLELGLLERDAEIQLLQRQLQAQRARLDETIREVVRTKAKLRSRESKAETVAALAEAQIALDTVGAIDELAGKVQLRRIHELIEMGKLEIEQENFGGAYYLITNAKNLIANLRSRSPSIDLGATEPNAIAFEAPLPFRVQSRANVRGTPDLESPVLFVAESGAEVTAIAHHNLWIRIIAQDGASGWIYYKVLATP